MSAVRIVYHLARADFLERVRRYSFLIMLGLGAFLGYQVAVGNIALRLDIYRGEFNSAWVGSMMALIGSFFLGWFGFYLVKGSMARDRETGVGQIMAATPLTRLLYTFGKWASNFSVLMAMILVLAIAGIGIQFLAGENTHLDLLALLAPFLFVTMPVMALVAAIAVLFESIGFLSGGFSNVLYFFLFFMLFPVIDKLSAINLALEPLGLGLFQQSMGAAAKAAFPEYNGGFVLGDPATASSIFQWTGVHWTSDILLMRLALFGIAIVLTLIASVFFDRFDASRRKPATKPTKKNASKTKPEPAPITKTDSAVQFDSAKSIHGTIRICTCSGFRIETACQGTTLVVVCCGWRVVYCRSRQPVRDLAHIPVTLYVALAGADLVRTGQPCDSAQRPADGFLVRRAAVATVARQLAGRFPRHPADGWWCCAALDRCRRQRRTAYLDFCCSFHPVICTGIGCLEPGQQTVRSAVRHDVVFRADE